MLLRVKLTAENQIQATTTKRDEVNIHAIHYSFVCKNIKCL